MNKRELKDLNTKEIDTVIDDENLNNNEGSIIKGDLNIDSVEDLRESLKSKDTTIEELKHDIELLWKDNQEKNKTIKDQNIRILKLTDKLTDSLEKGYELHQNTQVLFKQLLEKQPEVIKKLGDGKTPKGFFNKLFKR